MVKDPKTLCALFMLVAFVGLAMFFGTDLVAREMTVNQSGVVDEGSAMEVRQAGAWMIFIGGAVVAMCMFPKMMKGSEKTFADFGKRLRRRR